MVDDWQSPDLDVGHVAGHFFEFLIFKAVFDVFGHHLPHPGLWTLSLGDTADRNIAIGNHTNEMVVFTNWQSADIETRHYLSCMLDRFLRIRDTNTPCHRFTYFHCYLPLIATSVDMKP